MASRFALLVRFFCYLPIPVGLQIPQENPFLLLVFWFFYFPSHLETGSAEEWENEKNNGKDNVIALNPRGDWLWSPQEGWGVYKLHLSLSRVLVPPHVVSDWPFLEGKFFGPKISWNIPEVTKFHLPLSFDTHPPELEVLFFSKWKICT